MMSFRGLVAKRDPSNATSRLRVRFAACHSKFCFELRCKCQNSMPSRGSVAWGTAAALALRDDGARARAISADPRLQQGQGQLDLGCVGGRRADDEPLERVAIGRRPLLQGSADPL